MQTTTSMKANKSFTLLLLLIIATASIYSCDSDNKRGNTKMSECLAENSSAIPETIQCKAEANNSLVFLHLNVLADCASVGCQINVKVEGSTLIIYEEFLLDNSSANCSCPRDVEYTIHKLEYKEYAVKIMRSDRTRVYAQFNLNFQKGSNEVITVHKTAQ